MNAPKEDKIFSKPNWHIFCEEITQFENVLFGNLLQYSDLALPNNIHTDAHYYNYFTVHCQYQLILTGTKLTVRRSKVLQFLFLLCVAATSFYKLAWGDWHLITSSWCFSTLTVESCLTQPKSKIGLNQTCRNLHCRLTRTNYIYTV